MHAAWSNFAWPQGLSQLCNQSLQSLCGTTRFRLRTLPVVDHSSPPELWGIFHADGPLLSAGADPMADLLKLADEMKFSKKFEKVSLGQGQGPKAERLLEAGMDRGIWVCLQVRDSCLDHLDQAPRLGSWMAYLL